MSVLAIAYLALHFTIGARMTVREKSRVALGAGMVVAGVAHFLAPTPFVQHLPEIVPQRLAIIYATGVFEVGLGVALLRPHRWQSAVGLALAAYLVAVFPANVYVAVAGVEVSGQPGGLYPWLRLPLQAAFVWLALWSTEARLPAPRRTRAAAP